MHSLQPKTSKKAIVVAVAWICLMLTLLVWIGYLAVADLAANLV